MTIPDGRRVLAKASPWLEPTCGWPSDEDAALDAMLASWAAHYAPTAEHLEAIRCAVLDQAQMAGDTGLAEAILPLEWWERFFIDLQAGLRHAVNLESVWAAAGCAA